MASKQPQLQISLAQHIASLFNLQSRTSVIVRKVEPESVAIDYVEIAIRDQYISRSDMWILKLGLEGRSIFVGQKLNAFGMRGQIRLISNRGQSWACGLVTRETKVIYRSESAKFILFLQLCREMWEFD
ncbi:hypothetical protein CAUPRSCDRAFT_9467, partial [Caulochytrium protostelioides]